MISVLTVTVTVDWLIQDMEDGAGLGISGTPGFFIGRYDSVNRRIKGELLSGAQPLSAFENLIAKYLAKP